LQLMDSAKIRPEDLRRLRKRIEEDA